AALQLLQCLRLELIQRPDWGVAELVHARQVFGDVSDGLLVLQQAHQFESLDRPALSFLCLGHLAEAVAAEASHVIAVLDVAEATRVDEIDQAFIVQTEEQALRWTAGRGLRLTTRRYGLQWIVIFRRRQADWLFIIPLLRLNRPLVRPKGCPAHSEPRAVNELLNVVLMDLLQGTRAHPASPMVHFLFEGRHSLALRCSLR